MQSTKLPGPIRRALALLTFCAALSACGPRIVLTPPALPCADLVTASGLLEPTPGARLPENDTVGEIAAFGDRESGQLDKANADKAGAKGILAVCQKWQATATKQATPKRFLGLF